MPDKKLYRVDDEMSFRQCDLAMEDNPNYGDCTNFTYVDRNWTRYYVCSQDGIHYHCSQHPEQELEHFKDSFGYEQNLQCPRCKRIIKINSESELRSRCLRLLNASIFKDATLIRVDDWYYPEVKQKEKIESAYWISTQVKTDKDGDTIIVVYVGSSTSKVDIIILGRSRNLPAIAPPQYETILSIVNHDRRSY